MYTTTEREIQLQRVLHELQTLPSVQGAVQIGSGATGYQDEHSDIDLMIAARNESDPKEIKQALLEYFMHLSPILIKEKQFAPDIYLLIVFLNNRLEFNISFAPLEKIPVRSPLWRVVYDCDGQLQQKMLQEHARFLEQSVRYDVGDVPFEFIYASFALDKELKRDNLIYALALLETMRELTRLSQALKEERKVHQFKAYHMLNSQFIAHYLRTFPSSVDTDSIKEAKQALHRLFLDTLDHHPQFQLEKMIEALLIDEENF
ncbi:MULTISPECIES: nucleotidyltransferase domain-containing protein [Exiguobacterium]|uniref:nucleotidyltransferase domain-containing protein n=1 Tax=Exiguobacterium TaxID=33986 RepID=UPI001BEC783D|nr:MULTISPECIES: nucleotidyltransferase domain-containing protein [Exiguobacterium]MCT4784006.1 nucleotidyltransferase domain-containing protein [Exiguobacterium himgiriensis]